MANGGYGVGLFDKSGPEGFATAVKGIGTALGEVTEKFTDLANKASGSLSQISSSIDALVKKLQGLSGGVAAAAGPGGGGGAAAGGGAGGTGAAGDWKSPPASQGGPASQGSPLAGMPQGTAAQLMGQFFQWMQEGSATGARATLGTSQVGGGGNGMPQFSASRAAQSMIPAAAGAAIKAVTSGPGQNLIANAVQGTTIGRMWGSGGAFGVSDRSLYQMPQGTLASSAGDYAQANYYALTQMGAAPGTRNWSTLQRGAQALMPMVPGMSRQGAFAVMNQMQQASTLQAGFRVGLNLRPGGNIMDPQAQFGMIFNRLTMGNKVSPDTFWKSLQPGGPGAANLQMLGITPGSDTYNAFLEYAQQALKSNQTGKPMPDMATSQGRKQAGLDTTYMSQLQAQSKAARAEQQLEPGIAAAAKNLNDAASALLQAATSLGLPGGLGGAIGGISNFLGGGGMMGLGLGMGTLGLARRIPGVGKLLGRIPGVGGMLGQKGGFTKAAGRGLLNLGSKLPGRLGGLFGGGAEAAAAAGGEAVAGEAAVGGTVAGMEAAGAALDATGVGLPVGLAIGAAGLGYGIFHKPINKFIGGLFGHHGHKKPEDSGAGGGGGGDDIASLLASKPPKGSLIDVLTQPAGAGAGGMVGGVPTQHKKHKGLFGSIGEMASGMLKSVPGVASIQSLLSGGGIQGALMGMINPFAGLGQMVGGATGVLGALGGGLSSFLGGTPASAQTMTGSPYAWKSKNLQSSPMDLSSLFQLYKPGMAPASQTDPSAGNGNADPGSGTGSGTGTGGTPSQNEILGKQMAAAVGWTGSEWDALNKVVHQESGWKTDATNPSSGAYGIPQSLPPEKMSSAGPDWKTNPKTQIKWLLDYVKGRYSTPSGALAHEQQHGWYARGTQQIARTQLAVLHRGEAVVPAADNYNAGGTYNRAGAMGGGAGTVYLNFRQGSIVLQVSNNPSQSEMDNVAKMFVTSISKSQVLAGVRST